MSEKLIWKPTGEELTWRHKYFLADLTKNNFTLCVFLIKNVWIARLADKDDHGVVSNAGDTAEEALDNLVPILQAYYESMSKFLTGEINE